MHIRIINADLCESCVNRTCAFVDARIKEQFYSIRTETTVCPQGILIDETKPASFGGKCINCALCVKSCFADNLEIVDYSQDFNIANLSELQYNAIALGYLDKITGFAANTNRNRSLNFDGFLQTKTGESCFVEVDYNNDSLECCRRLIGAFITYEGHIGAIRNGLIVLQEFPKEGSRDVFNVIEKLASFPSTKDCQIYFCTFSLLRHMMLRLDTSNFALLDLFYNRKNESMEEYQQRIMAGRIINATSYSVQNELGKCKFNIYDDVEECAKFVDFLPVYNLKAACGYFEENATIPENDAEGWVDISESGIKSNKNMFVIYAAGNSMSPDIKDGDLCVFELYGPENGGSREGKIVLTECRDKDTDTDCHYTIKKYHSTWHYDEEGRKIHDTVELIPLNTDEYETRIFQSGEEYRTVGIFKCVL